VREEGGGSGRGGSPGKTEPTAPVSFRLKSDPQAGVQYGLIAEEVAKVYPELVIRDEKGKIEGVRYEELTPMLLNEVQRQQAQLRDVQQPLAELQEFRHLMRGRAANQQAHALTVDECIVRPLPVDGVTIGPAYVWCPPASPGTGRPTLRQNAANRGSSL